MLAAQAKAATAPAIQFVSTWEAPPAQPAANTDFGGFTTRQTLHVSLGGKVVRLRISNAYGVNPVTIGTVHIASRLSDDTIVTKDDTAFTFGGLQSVTIPPGAVAISDALAFHVTMNSDYLVTLFTPTSTGNGTWHPTSSHPVYCTYSYQMSAATMTGEFVLSAGNYFITGLDVEFTGQKHGIVTIGDSITDGYGSTFDTDTSWPNDLATDLSGLYGNRYAVADAGIGSNRILADYSPGVNQSALARFDRDVLALPNVSQVIIAEGINDINFAGDNASPSADDIIAGLQQLIQRAHDHGLTVIGATITPNSLDSIKEVKRQAINLFVRGSGAFDAVMDFDAAVRDPSNPSAMLSSLSYDGLHPNSAGYAAMAATYPYYNK